jgi:hypothetical protein
LPEWLLASLLISIGFGICFGLFLDSRRPWVVAGIAAAAGFGLALVVLSLASARSPNTPEGQRLAPPAIIRVPILVALIGFGPFFWLIEGPAAAGLATEVLRLLWLALIVAAVGWRVRELLHKSNRVSAVDALALAVALINLGLGIALVITRHVG